MIPRPIPILFYHSPDFEGERAKFIYTDYGKADLKMIGSNEIEKMQYFSMLNRGHFERYGTLKGEYVYLNPYLLIDRNGCGTVINMDGDDFQRQLQMCDIWESEGCRHIVRQLVNDWDKAPCVNGIPLLTDTFAWNYFHFSILIVPKMRFFRSNKLFVTDDALSRPAHSSLLAKAMGDRKVIAFAPGMKVVDPVIAESNIIHDGLLWLRDNVKFDVRPGSKNYYIRRSGGKVRTGGICESEEFLRLLKDFGFEFIEFGNGNLAVERQVRLLDGAGVVLSAHGASLTNLAYLSSPLSVIEVFPPLTRHLCPTCYMEFSAILDFRHRGIVAEGYNIEDKLVLNCDALRDVLAEVCESPVKSPRVRAA